MNKLILITLGPIASMAQTLKTFKTWYDPFTQNKVHEVWTSKPSPPYPKHGVYKEFDDHGVMVAEVNYSNGLKNGISKEYNHYVSAHDPDFPQCISGKVIHTCSYKNDVLDGWEIWYDYVKCKQIKTVEKLFKDGEVIKVITYYPNGKVETKSSFKDGIRNGQYLEYYENGVLAVKVKYKNDKMVDTVLVYRENSKLYKRIIVDPVTYIDKLYLEYAKNGKLVFERRYISDVKFQTIEYDSLTGNAIRKYHEKADQQGSDYLKEGKYEMFDKNGKVVVYGQLLNDKKEGFWKMYFDNKFDYANNLDSAVYYREISFKNDKPDGLVKDFYINGTKQFDGYLFDVDPDVVDGKAIYYYTNGKKESEGEYKSDKKVGKWIYYKENGEIEKEIEETKP